MIVNQDKVYYPLDFSTMVKDGKIYYERDDREECWFYLDLRTGERDPEE